MGGAPYASQGVPCARSRRARVRLRVRFLRGLCAHLPRGHHMPVLYSPSGWFHLPFPAVFHKNTRVPPFHWWVPDFGLNPAPRHYCASSSFYRRHLLLSGILPTPIRRRLGRRPAGPTLTRVYKHLCRRLRPPVVIA